MIHGLERFGGKGFSVMGDSISTLAGVTPAGWRVHYGGEAHVPGVADVADTWWGQVIERCGGHLVASSSFSGSVVEGFGFPAGNSDERVAALRGADGELPDVVLVLMGINDYGWGGGCNQVLGGSLSASATREELPLSCEFEPVGGEQTLRRFEAAYAEMLARIGELASDAEIWCVTLCPATHPDPALPCFKYRIRGIDLDAYNDAIRASAAGAGAWVADIRTFGIAYDAVDGCHPSARGMTQIADMVLARMVEDGPVELPASCAGAPRAVRTCDRCCADCPLDDTTLERWGIVCAGPGQLPSR